MTFRSLSVSVEGAETLVIMLPGLRVTPEDFTGLIAQLQSTMPADAMALAIGSDDYLDAALAARLHETIAASRPRYARIVILALSLGALGALRYVQTYRDHLNGLILLAPFLGNPGTIAEIERSGGFAAWSPGALAPSDMERPGLVWLKAQRPRPWLHLAFGREDRFAAGARLLAEILPPSGVTSLPGDHDWPTWTRLWAVALARLQEQKLLG